MFPVSFANVAGNYDLVTRSGMAKLDFPAVFDRHKDAVYRFAWRMTNSPSAAEDITQDVFLALLRHPERFDSERGEMRSFLFGVARNLIQKRWRNEKRWD